MQRIQFSGTQIQGPLIQTPCNTSNSSVSRYRPFSFELSATHLVLRSPDIGSSHSNSAQCIQYSGPKIQDPLIQTPYDISCSPVPRYRGPLIQTLCNASSSPDLRYRSLSFKLHVTYLILWYLDTGPFHSNSMQPITRYRGLSFKLRASHVF